MLKSEIRRKREQAIISALNKYGILTAEMVGSLNVSGLGKTSNRNVLRVLNEMVSDGYLQSLRKENKMYCVSGRGFAQHNHKLMMNKFIIDKGLNSRVRIEPKVKLGNEQFRPDFMIPIVNDPKNEKDWRFYEVDITQSKKVNIEKIERYKRLGLQFEVICYEHRRSMWKGCVVNIVE